MDTSTSNILPFINEIRTQHPVHHSLYLEFDGMRFRVAASTDAITDGLAHYFSGFVVPAGPYQVGVTVIQAPEADLPVAYTDHPPGPGKTRVKEAFADLPGGRIIRKVKTGMVFIVGSDQWFAVGPAVENLNQVVNFINNALMARNLDRGYLLGHASGVVYNGRGLAMAGFAGSGKSTLALHVMGIEGVQYLSNDRIMMKIREGRPVMKGLPKLPRINPGTALNNPSLASIVPSHERERYQRLSDEERWTLEQKYDVFIDDHFGPGRMVLNGPMDGLVILNWSRETKGQCTIREIDPRASLPLLDSIIKSPGLFYRPSTPIEHPSPEDYAALLTHCRVFEVTGGVDFDYATRFCFRFLAETTEGAATTENNHQRIWD
ncbi:MAG: HprK-related kinase B [Thermodesulfobacteriota bacterium]|nr:HprK-related kinase B [Thermodesulfobacteriota bacterium]